MHIVVAAFDEQWNELTALRPNINWQRVDAAADFDQYDMIYVMAKDVLHEMKEIAGSKFNVDKVDFCLNVLHPEKNNDVPDPWYGDEDGYTDVYTIIDEACDAIIAKALTEQKATI